MISDQKNCKVTIFGHAYTLASTQSEEFVKRSAALVDLMMREVSPSASATLDVRQVAVLTALRLAGHLILLEEKIDQAHKKESALVSLIENVATR